MIALSPFTPKKCPQNHNLLFFIFVVTVVFFSISFLLFLNLCLQFSNSQPKICVCVLFSFFLDLLLISLAHYKILWWIESAEWWLFYNALVWHLSGWIFCCVIWHTCIFSNKTCSAALLATFFFSSLLLLEFNLHLSVQLEEWSGGTIY